MENKIDISKKYTTRQGWEVELFTDKASGDRPVVGQMFHPDAGWRLLSWVYDGSWSLEGEHANDLIEVKEKRTVTGWMYVNKAGQGLFYSEKVDLDPALEMPLAILPVEIEFEEGDGLDG